MVEQAWDIGVMCVCVCLWISVFLAGSGVVTGLCSVWQFWMAGLHRARAGGACEPLAHDGEEWGVIAVGLILSAHFPDLLFHLIIAGVLYDRTQFCEILKDR